MEFTTLVFLIVGVPSILIALGFFALCLRWFLTRNKRADHNALLEAAVQLDGRLAKLEGRINALEDILLTGDKTPGETERKVRDFDERLRQTP
jgi:hypothetical protein